MRDSIVGTIANAFAILFDGTRSFIRALSASLPYLFNMNPNTLRKEVTEQYPDPVSSRTVDDLPPRTKGLIQNDIDQCIGCRECAKSCPVDCFTIESERLLDTQKEWVSLFDIDHSKCISCSLCVEVCPTSSLSNSKRYEFAAYDRKEMVESFGKGEPPRRGEYR
ncbi:MAG: 4Fe-4S binding protein [Cryobacterium sp.]|nr:4Fe-4S binding protein [Oligoflexia bacterium]